MFLAETTEADVEADAEEAQTAAEEVAEDSVAVDAAVVNEEASDQDTKKNPVFSLKVDHWLSLPI